MSYDYNKSVESISTLRAKAYRIRPRPSSTTADKQNKQEEDPLEVASLESLSQVVDEFTALADKCPLPPALWVQYGHDAFRLMEHLLLAEEEEEQEEEANKSNEKDKKENDENETKQQTPKESSDNATKKAARKQANDLRVDIFKNSIEVFPGCARLHLEYFTSLLFGWQLLDKKRQLGKCKAIKQAMEKAIKAVGRGTHRKDGNVVKLWRLFAHFEFDRVLLETEGAQAQTQDTIKPNEERGGLKTAAEAAAIVFAKRAATPLDEANQGLVSEVDQFFATRLNTKSVKRKREDTSQEPTTSPNPVLLNWRELSVPTTALHLYQNHDTSSTTLPIEQALEQGRREAAKTFGKFSSHETEVQSGLHQEGLLFSLKEDGSGDDENGQMEDTEHWHLIQPDFSKLQKTTDTETASATGTDTNTDAASSSSRYLMGLGERPLATAFLNYARALSSAGHSKHHKQQQQQQQEEAGEHAQTMIPWKDLAMSMYERTVSECPTVEEVWLAYIHAAFRRLEEEPLDPQTSKQSQPQTHEERKKRMTEWSSITERATKNCPYSVTLHGWHMRAVASSMLDPALHGITSSSANSANSAATSPSAGGVATAGEEDDVIGELGQSVLRLAASAVACGFLPTAQDYVEVYLEATRVIRRCIMVVVCKGYDEVGVANDQQHDDDKNNNKRKKKEQKLEKEKEEAQPNMLAQDQKEEILEYLLEDLREAYQVADTFLRTTYPNWTAGRSTLWLERSMVEAHVIHPVLRYLRHFQREGQGPADGRVPGKRVQFIAPEDSMDHNGKKEKEEDATLQCLEKLVRIYPQAAQHWTRYISHVMNCDSASHTHKDNDKDKEGLCSDGLFDGLKRARSLYHRAIKSISVTAPESTDGATDGSAAVLSWAFLDDFVLFERTLGSEDSLRKAMGMVKSKKMSSTRRSKTGGSQKKGQPHHTQQQMEMEEPKSKKQRIEPEVKEEGSNNGVKRVRDDDQEEELETDDRRKRQKETTTDDAKEEEDNNTKEDAPDSNHHKTTSRTTNNSNKKTNLKVESKRDVQHTVHIGKLSYPAHPFTVRVSNLSFEAEDMDLVDTFGICGTIVHARILREKEKHPTKPKGKGKHDHHQQQHAVGKSKGAGLVQFEDRSSVEEALRLHEEVGICERLVHVSRSHIPAVPSVVPAGMHRVNPKGKGRSSKMNMKKKKQHEEKNDGGVEEGEAGQASGTSAESSKKESNADAETTSRSLATAADASQDKMEIEVTSEKNVESRKEPSKKGAASGALATDLLAFRPRGVIGRRKKKWVDVPSPKTKTTAKTDSQQKKEDT